MPDVYYFAYGSNMLTERLQRRCPSTKALGPASIDGWEVKFSKIGRDASGKATLCRKAGAKSYGVVFTLDRADIPLLDQFEGAGRGYDRMDDVNVQLLMLHDSVNVVTYIAPAEFQSNALRPFDWYKGLVLAGAHQHALPEDYIKFLQSVPHIPDPDVERQTRFEAIDLLHTVNRPSL